MSGAAARGEVAGRKNEKVQEIELLLTNMHKIDKYNMNNLLTCRNRDIHKRRISY